MIRLRFRSRLRERNAILFAQVLDLQEKLAASRKAATAAQELTVSAADGDVVAVLRRQLSDVQGELKDEKDTSTRLRQALRAARAELAGVEIAKTLAGYPSDAEHVIEEQRRNLNILANQLADAEGRNAPVRQGGWHW